MQHDLIVIGGGPGGYVAAFRAAQLGMNVALVEKEAKLGGTCLRVGCIPSKALLESTELYSTVQNRLGPHGINVGELNFDLAAMHKRKRGVVDTLAKGLDALVKKNKVTRYLGTGRLDGPGRVVVAGEGQTTELVAPHIILATGSKPAPLPGVTPDGGRIGTSTEALAYEEPPQKLVVIGAGYIGLELGAVWSRLGSQVLVLEYLDRILPGTDLEVANDALKIFKHQGLQFRLSMKVIGATATDEGVKIEVEGTDPIMCDRVLLATGRVPMTDGLELAHAGVATDNRGRVEVNERFQTSVEGVYAIGDLIAGPMLAHKAEEEGVACVEWIATGYGHVDYGAIPSVAYTHPEIAAVGKTEEQLKEEGIAYRKGKFSFRGNGRARALGDTEGFVKVLADEATDRLLGVHIIGPRAGDLIAEAAAAMSFGASSEDVARTCHAHPTLSEAFKEACLAVDGRPLSA